MRKKLTKEKFIKDSRKIHNDFYDYTDIEFVDSREKVKIKCRIHGYFYQNPLKHKNGQGCPKCGRQKTITKQQLTQEEIIYNFNKIHQGKYDYKNVKYNGYHKKVGKEIKIDIKEVKKVSSKEPRVISKVDKNSFQIKSYI